MTTRDPRSRAPNRPITGREGVREPTQSISLEIEVAEDNPSLAVGTHEAERDNQTKIESPAGRNKTPVPRDSKAPPPTPYNPDDPDIRLGSQLGSYRLTELLGKGGMGYVYRAEHVKLGREVALKLLRGDYARRRDAVLRFFQEAKTVNRVRHRNIVDVTDFVELDDGTTFIIMEFLRGQSLGKWARTGIDMPRALAVLVQICDGLGAAHAVGVVHRDLKPDNVIVVPTSDGAELVKLLDFGVAKLLNRDDEDVGFQTAAGSVIGTPAYMSPEQAGGMAVDHRSDIYSLGAIIYELFCGQPMFRGRSFGEFVRKHLTEQPVLPRQTQGGANVDPRLEALIMKCLSKDPNERFSHILELRDGLLHMLGGIDTHPPGYASLANSALRPSQLPAMPLPAPGMVTTVPTPPHQMSTVHPSSLHPIALPPSMLQIATQPSQAPYGHYSQLPPTPSDTSQSTPWWVWLVGGTFAIGLGITGAVWYANRSGGLAPQTTQPVASATVEPAAPEKPQILALRFDSLPAGGVFAAGHSAELCHTPCTYNLDLRDGGPTDHRTFVIRSEHYRDKAVDVDLEGSQRDFSVTLELLEPTVPAAPVTDKGEVDTRPEADPRPDADTKPEVDTRPDRPERTGKRTGRGTKKIDKRLTEKTDKIDKPADKPVETVTKPVETVTKPEDKPPDKMPPDKTGDKKPDKIDPADTLDPFHRHK